MHRKTNALRKLLRATSPDDFAAIAREARAQLIVITALIRRYIHILAADLVLPPPRPLAPATQSLSESASGSARYQFPLIETASRSSPSSTGEDPPDLQWALLMEAAGRLVSVLANPAPHARRLARALRTNTRAVLRDLPIPWHITRRLDPALDTFMLRVDALARPGAWAGIEVDSS